MKRQGILHLTLLLWIHCSGVVSDSDHKFLGIGYNLLTGNPDGGDTETGGVDPGLLYTRKVWDLSNPVSVQAETRQSCAEQQKVSIFYGGKSYQDKLKLGVSLQGEGIAGIANFAFSLSSRFDRTKEQTSTEHKVFQDDQVTCNLGRQRFAAELAHAYSLSVTENFAASVCALPLNYDKNQYMQFLDDWGTHVTVQVELGTKNISRRESSLAEFVDHVVKTSGVDVTAGGSYMGFGGSLKVNYDGFKSSDNFESSFGSYSANLLAGTPTLPEPIGLKLEAIHAALDGVYWQNTTTLASHGVCTKSKTDAISQIQTNLATALGEYAAFKMASVPMDPDLKIPLAWPRGTYGLYKAATGCPSGNFTWFEGWRFQHSEEIATANIFSGNIHLAGLFEDKGDIMTEFCIKGEAQVTEYDLTWPAGDYCLAKYGDCPAGFQVGWLQWDDANDILLSPIVNIKSGGYLPDGVYNKDTKIFYCCRNDGLPTTEIHLPIDLPFYLLRHTRTCQTVHRMQVRDEFVYWDEQFRVVPSDNRAGGSSPFDDGNLENHKIHFCYYEPAVNSPIIG